MIIIIVIWSNILIFGNLFIDLNIIYIVESNNIRLRKSHFIFIFNNSIKYVEKNVNDEILNISVSVFSVLLLFIDSTDFIIEEVIANTSDIEQNIIPMISNFKDLKIIIRTRNTVKILANITDITMLNILLVIMLFLQIVY